MLFSFPHPFLSSLNRHITHYIYILCVNLEKAVKHRSSTAVYVIVCCLPCSL
ncbi:hypothetical protein DWW36_15870 [Erysipelotrichaceae bacterium AF15-26LB]|nr:hypothetical protein GKZ87_00770 [Erysipelotrichaceae bacterium 66202529]RJV84855.1 hypothetical protein DWW36_15870 [Erysipelotrichaceae bacterium AF15-26LB]RJV90174.1 hypothetical protein DWX45_09210 [Erysipelotrichaceae bacterium AF19-24AC]